MNQPMFSESLAYYLVARPFEGFIKTRFLGAPYIHFAHFLQMAEYLFQSGALIARAKLDNLTPLVRLFTNPGEESECISVWQSTAQARLDDYIKTFGEPTTSITNFVHNSEYKRRGVFTSFVSRDNLKPMLEQTRKIAVTKIPLKDTGPGLESTMLEGIGFGSSHPTLTELMFREGEKPIDTEQWAQVRGFASQSTNPLPETQEILTLEELEQGLLGMLATYTQANYPQIVEQLGIAEVNDSPVAPPAIAARLLRVISPPPPGTLERKRFDTAVAKVRKELEQKLLPLINLR